MNWELGISTCKLLHLEWIMSCCIVQRTICSHLRWNMMEDNVRKRMCIHTHNTIYIVNKNFLYTLEIKKISIIIRNVF